MALTRVRLYGPTTNTLPAVFKKKKIVLLPRMSLVEEISKGFFIFISDTYIGIYITYPNTMANDPQCPGSLDEICIRCSSGYARNFSNGPSTDGLRLPAVLIFHICEIQRSLKLLKSNLPLNVAHTHDLLVNLRQEVNDISFLDPGKKMERFFDRSMVCVIDDSRGYYDPNSSSGVPITIHWLATMFTARTVAGNYQVAPALDSVQMDNFIEERCPLELLSKIPINDVSNEYIPIFT